MKFFQAGVSLLRTALLGQLFPIALLTSVKF